MKDRKKLLIPLVLLVALAGGTGYYFWQRAENNHGRIRVSGTVEVTQAELSFKLPGRVEARLVSEGDRVEAGAVIARLESGELNQQVALQKALVRVAESVLKELETGARPEEKAQAEAAVAAAQAEFKRVEQDYLRMKDLFERGSGTEREYDGAKAGYDVAQARLRQAREQRSLVREGPRQEKIEQARANLEQAQAALGLAETRQGYAVLVSPMAGVVLSKSVEPGEFVSPGTPIVTVGDIENVYLRAYIEETELGRVKLGQKVRVFSDTYPDRVYQGELTFISPEAEFTPKNVQTKKERVKLVYRVKVEVPNPAQELKPGMPVEAEIVIAEPAKP